MYRIFLTMTKTQTMTISPVQEFQPPGPSSPETFELSIKTPAKTLRELSRRVASVAKPSSSSPGRVSSDEEENVGENVPPPDTAQHVVQRWNHPKGNIARLGFAFFSFIVVGMNDGAVGVWTSHLSLPRMQAC